MNSDTKKLVTYYENHKKVEMAYLFWLLTGFFGGHRFYLRKQGTAIAMLILTITIVGVLVTFVWFFIDGVQMPQMVRDCNRELRWDLGFEQT